ncbi:BTAD domain-containing putative transcriptional regulator [Devosia sp.]|uniref:AfsR/SARP family transcriptional regulator n=1 Tax=Devosia sp. TaxID=1871048 RepID=UPI001AD0B0E9|nr:BTAD domain-containing putative transcriptional regulator [Devosia sp.]MBN9332103.1 hypothetical protein [Devosia sp.]
MRRRVGDLIWSDNGSEQASADIRQALVRIRRFQLEHDLQLLAVDARMVWPTLADDIYFDLAEFVKLAANPTLSGCVRMCAIYNGELLSSLRAAGEGFEEWLSYQRTALRNDFVSTISEAVLPDSALSSHDRHFCAQSLLRIDPYHEGAHRALMRVAAENGQFSFLRKLFGEFNHKLRNELGVPPDEETIRLYQRLISQAHAT